MSFFIDNIEQVVNVFGLAVLVVCTVIVLAKRTWPSDDIRLCARGYFAAALLGDSYWAIYTIVFAHNPQYFYGAELAWLAEELFLLILVVELYSKEGLAPIHPVAWIGPALIAAFSVWYIVSTGTVVFNVLMGVAMSGIALFALTALFRSEIDRANGIERHMRLYLAAVAFVALEYTMWSCSVLDSSTSVANPYYLFSVLMYASMFCVAVAIAHLGVIRDGEDG